DEPVRDPGIGELVQDLRPEIVRPGVARAIHFRRHAAAAGELELHDCFHASIPHPCAVPRSKRRSPGHFNWRKVTSSLPAPVAIGRAAVAEIRLDLSRLQGLRITTCTFDCYDAWAASFLHSSLSVRRPRATSMRSTRP